MERITQHFLNRDVVNRSDKDQSSHHHHHQSRQSRRSRYDEHDNLLEELAKYFMRYAAHQAKTFGKGSDKHSQRGPQDGIRNVESEDLRRLGTLVLDMMRKHEELESSRSSRRHHNHSRERTRRHRRSRSGESKSSSDKHSDRTKRRSREADPGALLDHVPGGAADEYYSPRRHSKSSNSGSGSGSLPLPSLAPPYYTTTPHKERNLDELEEAYLAYPLAPSKSQPQDKATSDHQRRAHRKRRRSEFDLSVLRNELEDMSNTLTYLNARSPEHRDCEFYDRFVGEASRLQLAIGCTLGRIRRVEEEREDEGEAGGRRRYRG